MKFKLLMLALILAGCPKKETKSIEDIEREENLRQILNDLGEEDIEDLPEAGEDDTGTKQR